MRADWENAGFGLYVHWPFCQAKCPYCDFNSHVRQTIDHDAWADALVAELIQHAEPLKGRTLNSVFFGGGTPSLMQPKTVDRILNTAAEYWSFAADIEITLEANPTSSEAQNFTDFAKAGVNRLSMGIQALNDNDLKALGRMHNSAEAMAAFDIARGQFARVSFDLIYARQHQTAVAWEAELKRALDMAVDHLSLYQLTVEAGTRFGELYDRDKLKGLPDPVLSAELYDLTQEITTSYGMPGYEVSNHARSGAQSRHNLIYWRYGDYLGIGPGAHSRITSANRRVGFSTEKHPEHYLAARADKRDARNFHETLSARDQATEYLMMSLRLVEGASLKRFATLGGRDIQASKISSLVEDGFLNHVGDQISATDKGRIVLNTLLVELLEDSQ